MHPSLRGIATLLILFSAIHSTGWGATLTVGPGGGFDHPTLSAALAAAATDDTLSVAPGTYSATTGETFPLAPKASITIRASSTEASPAVIGNTSDSVFYLDHIGSATFEGIEIRKGGNSGVYIESTTTVIIDSVLAQNQGTIAGGVYAFWSDLAVYGSQIVDNITDGGGGGIYLSGGGLTLADCNISGNQTGGGGAVRIFRCPNLKVQNSWITENRTTSSSSAIDSSGFLFDERFAVALIEDCTIARNSGTGSGSRSVLALDRYNLTIRNSTIFENSIDRVPTRSFAVRAESFAEMEIHDTVIRDNTGMGGVSTGTRDGHLELHRSRIIRNEGTGLRSTSLVLNQSIVSQNGFTGAETDTFQISDSSISENYGSGLTPTGSGDYPVDNISAVTDTLISGNGAYFYESPQANQINTGGAYLVTHTRFRNCEIVDNRGGSGAGGLFCARGASMEDCLIEGNSTSIGVAAIHFASGESVVKGCRFIDNSIDPKDLHLALLCGSNNTQR